jgi:tetratricopeptide (TPR) repeat protein
MNRLGPYEVGGELARGGMGVVYRARDPFLDRQLALKVISADDFHDPEGQERFRREALVLARLRHSGVVPVHGAGLTPQGYPYLVMDLIAGGSLEARLAAGPLAPAEAVRLTRQVAEAADYAHREGVLHRDIKPGNVLLSGRGDAVLSDFGLAKLVGEDRLTQTGDILGTPSYMAPEQVQGQVSLTPAVDVYALGATLYRMLTGRPPLAAATTTELFMKVVEVTPPPASEFVNGIDEELEEILARCLEKSPKDRFGSMGALAKALEAWESQAAPARVASMEIGAARARSRARLLRALAALSLAVALGALVGLELAPPLQRVRRAYREVAELPPEQRALFDRGQSRLEREDFVGAKEDFLGVSQAEPRCDTAWLGLARARVGLGEGERALEDLDRALALDAENASVWLERGKILHGAGRAEEAVAAFRKGVEHKPWSAAQQISLAVGLRAIGDETAAQLAWKESCQRDPRLAQNFTYEAAYGGGTLEEQVAILDAGWEVDPTNEELLSVRALLRARLGPHEKAIEAYDEWLRTCVEKPDLFVQRAELNLEKGDFSTGMGDFRVALQIAPEDPVVRFRRGVWLFKNQHYSSSRYDLVFAEKHGSEEIAAAATKVLAPVREAEARGDYMINQRVAFVESLEKGAKLLGALNSGDLVQLVHSSGGWAKIEVETRGGKLRGFVPQKAISLRVKLGEAR